MSLPFRDTAHVVGYIIFDKEHMWFEFQLVL